MNGNMQSPCESSAREAAFQLALAANHAPCTVDVDVVLICPMLLLSLSQHAPALPPYPPRPFSLLSPCGSWLLPCLPIRSVDASPLGALLDVWRAFHATLVARVCPPTPTPGVFLQVPLPTTDTYTEHLLPQDRGWTVLPAGVPACDVTLCCFLCC